MEGQEDKEEPKETPALRLKHLKSSVNVPFFRSQSTIMDNFQAIMHNNRIWSEAKIELDPDYF
jgi:hypothetical protein